MADMFGSFLKTLINMKSLEEEFQALESKHKGVRKPWKASKCVYNQNRRKSKKFNFNTKDLKMDLSSESNLHNFTSFIDFFQSILNEIKIDEKSKPLVIEILLSAKNTIQQKIENLSVHHELDKKMANTNSCSKLPKGLTSNESGLLSKSDSLSSTTLTKCIDSNLFFKQIKCPFCLKGQSGKFHLIKHLEKECHKKTFEKVNEKLQYSQMQILPNNSFKCNICPNFVSKNIKAYYFHITSLNHLVSYNKVKESKSFTDDLFCSCCKILVPNTYNQIHFHLDHKEHQKNMECFLKNISFAYKGQNKFRCVLCLGKTEVLDSLDCIVQHSNKKCHIVQINKKGINKIAVHCEPCHIIEEGIDQIKTHFNSLKHKENNKKIVVNERFELCFYCGTKFSDLIELSEHLPSSCPEVRDLLKKPEFKRSEGRHIKIEKIYELKEMNNERNESEECIDFEKESEKDGRFVFIKGCKDILHLVSYFKKIGDIESVEKYERDILAIQFKEESSVRSLMLLKNVIEIEDEKIEISLDPRELLLEGTTDEEESCSSSSSEDDDSSSDADDILTQQTKNYIENFYKILSEGMDSEHMGNMDRKGELTQIMSDCTTVLKCNSCVEVGFGEYGMFSKNDIVNLFCGFETDLHEENLKQDMLQLYFLKPFSTAILEKNFLRIRESNLWEDVEINEVDPLPYIKCKHKETQKTCRITFMESALAVTNMFRKCASESSLVQPFVLVTKMWLVSKQLLISEFPYLLMSLMIYFFISMKITPISLEQKDIHKTISNLVPKDITFDLETSKDVKMSELFKKFVKFLLHFDFSRNAICLPLSHPVPRNLLSSKNFKFYTKDVENAPMCVMDPFCCINLASGIVSDDLHSLLVIAKKQFNDLMI